MSTVGAYHVLTRRQRQLDAVMRTVLAGTFLGLFDDDDLDELDRGYYDQAAEPVDGSRARYTESAHIQRGLFEWERAAVESHFPPGSSVAVLGAGSGREVLALLEAGYDARGYEPNALLVEAGQRALAAAGHKDRLERVPRAGASPSLRGAEGLIVGWGVYSLVRGAHRRVALLRDSTAQMAPGTPVLVSFLTRGMVDRRVLALLYVVAGAVRVARRRGRVELGDALAPHFVHFFAEKEVTAELDAAGIVMDELRTAGYGRAVGTVRG